MATVFTGQQAEMVNPTPNIHSAGEVYVVEGKYAIQNTAIINDIFKLCRLPPGSIPIDCRLEMDDLDSATSLVVSLGLMLIGGAALITNSELIKTSTLGQAGGVARMDAIPAARRLILGASVDYERFVALQITTAAGTAASGRVKASVLYRGKEYNDGVATTTPPTTTAAPTTT